MRIAITGASGFVGRHIARLARERGHEVLALSRRDPKLSGVEFRSWDITTEPPTALRKAAESVDAVIHAAAAVNDWTPVATARAVNIAGTQNVAQTFPTARLVHVSSSSIYPPMRPSVQIQEDSITVGPHIKYLNTYAATKARAEVVVRGAVLNGNARNAIILRPHAVYGPGDETLLPRIEAAVRDGQLWLPGGGAVAQNLTHVATLASAALEAAQVDWARAEPHAAGEGVVAMNVTDGQPVLLRRALTEVLKRRGVNVKIRTIPLPLAWTLATALETGANLGRRHLAPRLTRYLVAQLGYERTYNLRRLREILNIEAPPTDFRDAHTW